MKWRTYRKLRAERSKPSNTTTLPKPPTNALSTPPSSHLKLNSLSPINLLLSNPFVLRKAMEEKIKKIFLSSPPPNLYTLPTIPPTFFR